MERGTTGELCKPAGGRECAQDNRAKWECPELRRLAANMAAGGSTPCNDGQGGGGCNNEMHS
jgi:hypothetical protein